MKMRMQLVIVFLVTVITTGISGNDPGSKIEYTLRFSPDGHYLAAADNTGHVRIFNMVNKTIQYDFSRAGAVEAIVFSEDNHYLATGFGQWRNANLCIWDLRTGNPFLYQSIDPGYMDISILKMQFLPGDRLLLVWTIQRGCCGFYDYEIYLVDVRTGKKFDIETMKFPEMEEYADFRDIFFHNSRQELHLLTSDSLYIVYDFVRKRKIQSIRLADGYIGDIFAFSGDMKMFGSITDTHMQVTDLEKHNAWNVDIVPANIEQFWFAASGKLLYLQQNKLYLAGLRDKGNKLLFATDGSIKHSVDFHPGTGNIAYIDNGTCYVVHINEVKKPLFTGSLAAGGNTTGLSLKQDEYTVPAVYTVPDAYEMSNDESALSVPGFQIGRQYNDEGTVFEITSVNSRKSIVLSSGNYSVECRFFLTADKKYMIIEGMQDTDAGHYDYTVVGLYGSKQYAVAETEKGRYDIQYAEQGEFLIFRTAWETLFFRPKTFSFYPVSNCGAFGFSQDHTLLAVYDLYGTIEILDTAAFKTIARWQDAGTRYGVEQIAFTPNNRLCAALLSNQQLCFYDPAAGKTVAAANLETDAAGYRLHFTFTNTDFSVLLKDKGAFKAVDIKPGAPEYKIIDKTPGVIMKYPGLFGLGTGEAGKYAPLLPDKSTLLFLTAGSKFTDQGDAFFQLDNDRYLFAMSAGTGQGNFLYLACMSQSGKSVWELQLPEMQLLSLLPTTDKGFAAACSSVISGMGSVVKFSGEGRIEWQQAYAYHPSQAAFFQTSDQGYIFYAHQSDENRSRIFNLDSRGNLQWCYALPENCHILDSCPGPLDNLYLLCSLQSRTLLMCMDSNCRSLWVKSLTAKDEFTRLQYMAGLENIILSGSNALVLLTGKGALASAFRLEPESGFAIRASCYIPGQGILLGANYRAGKDEENFYLLNLSLPGKLTDTLCFKSNPGNTLTAMTVDNNGEILATGKTLAYALFGAEDAFLIRTPFALAANLFREESGLFTVSNLETKVETAALITLTAAEPDKTGQGKAVIAGKTVTGVGRECWWYDYPPAQVRALLYSNWLTYEKDYYLYHPVQTFDNDPLTGWIEHSQGPGIGDYIGLQLYDTITIDAIEVMPGYFNPKWYKNNNRVKRLEIEVNTKKYQADFKDIMQPQTYTFPQPVTFNRMLFRIAEIYLSGIYNDTALAEIRFFFKGTRILVDLSLVNQYKQKITREELLPGQ